MQRLNMHDTLNAKPEFTSINARLVLERGTDEPLLLSTGSSLPWKTARQYAIDQVSAVRILVNAQIRYEILKWRACEKLNCKSASPVRVALSESASLSEEDAWLNSRFQWD